MGYMRFHAIYQLVLYNSLVVKKGCTVALIRSLIYFVYRKPSLALILRLCAVVRLHIQFN